MKSVWIWIVSLLIFAGPIASIAAQTPGGTAEILLFSDFHMDSSNRFDKYGYDSSERLVTNALASAHSHCPNPAAIIVTGDFFTHFKERPDADRFEAITNTVTKIAGFFANTFPGVPVLPVLGNNDSDKGDYELPSPDFLRIFADSWRTLVPNNHEKDTNDFATHFRVDGGYTAELTTLPNLEFVVFNSTAASRRFTNGDDSVGKAVVRWVSNCVHQAAVRTNKVWILFHIPLGRSLYDGKRFWRPDVENDFLRMLDSSSSTVTAMLCGHTHMDEFRVICDAHKAVAFEHFVPSVSPDHTNNPAYQIARVDVRSSQISDYASYYLPFISGRWKPEYSFKEDFPLGSNAVSEYNAEYLSDVVSLIGSNQNFSRKFKRFYNVSSMAFHPNFGADYTNTLIIPEPPN